MTREELGSAMLENPPAPGQLMYVQRRGDSYMWSVVGEADASPPSDVDTGGDTGVDAWIYYSGAWPDPGRFSEFFDDLLAEMESMTGGSDRCRWPLDETRGRTGTDVPALERRYGLYRHPRGPSPVPTVSPSLGSRGSGTPEL